MRALAALVCFAVSLLPGPALASETGEQKKVCDEVADAYSVVVTCEYVGATLAAAQSAEPDAEWIVYQLCKDGTSGGPEACSNPRVCTVGDTTGTLYVVFRDGQRMGIACLTASEAVVADKPSIRSLVIATFEDLAWKPSTLVVQPPDGRTLVNLETNFYTENSDYQSIEVTLQGVTVVVNARPISYRWNFGDGSSSETAEPGAPYPSLDVSHIYSSVDDVAVSVDTLYGDASYTVNGGEPQMIPSTRWVDGETQGLEVLEALPQLVNR